ncbi:MULTISPECIES: tail assembly protein [Rhodopseudomonas]|uniref:Tail assembly protein n=1 Tax=Rhodopseudomonas palustris TaxID=1076 RepID=A0A0D7EQI9_RHOPL|nr:MULTISPECIES: tail assembly protein [Rhodopseudomonas]KIZ43094.1 hypothetical protein OO17_11855 [Rhodopseudomonas palustris]MDF3810677.1 tail assembly protein [Rhodopseudomonas sp. BAL398]WOK18469.1 tail assembly protein [Rhodopseudomonas sp. BAL398]
MMRTVHLHGKLKKQFGASHRFDVATAGEALRALNCAFPGDFVTALQTGSYQLVRGARHTGASLADLKLINHLKLGAADLHLIPAAKGAASSKGTAKVILGAALIGGAIFLSGGTLAAPLSLLSGPVLPGIGITWGNIAMVGLGITLAGASTLLAKPAATATDTEADKSKTLSGAGNNGIQGAGIQLIYGETMVVSTMISMDADIEDTGVYIDSSGSIADPYNSTPVGGIG